MMNIGKNGKMASDSNPEDRNLITNNNAVIDLAESNVSPDSSIESTGSNPHQQIDSNNKSDPYYQSLPKSTTETMDKQPQNNQQQVSLTIFAVVFLITMNRVRLYLDSIMSFLD